MIVRRLLYLLALLGCVVFYWAYREWLSWFFLLLVLLAPLFSLAVSLPAMLTCRAKVKSPGDLVVGGDGEILWTGSSPYPLPELDGKLLVRHAITGQTLKLRSGDLLPTGHCGALEISLQKPFCYDYLGLFRLPIRKTTGAVVLVRPKPVKLDAPPDLSRFQINAWRPKAGGGFSENHELRLYRPGDHLRQVHWKLSAKTGKLIIREPMEALQNRLLLTMTLRGTGQQLDRKLGMLSWMSRYLLQQELRHHIHVLTGEGMQLFTIDREEDVQEAVDALLRSPGALEESEPNYMSANWRYHIGGDDSEA